MLQYLLTFVAGIAGSFHCIGMCGGFACALSPDPRGRSATLIRHLTYNSGRVSTYLFLGGLAGAFGASIADNTGLQRSFAVISGLLMLFIGARFFGYLKRSRRMSIGFAGGVLVQGLRGLTIAPGHSAPLALGVLNGFLPCPLVYAFAVQAAASGGPLQGLAVMLAFGLGTFPAMLLMGGVGGLLRPVWRRRGVFVAGGFILLLGTITVVRGLIPLTGHQHGL